MSDNKRDSNRVGLVIDIKMIIKDENEYLLKSRNISDTGVFLEYQDTPINLPVGSRVVLQVCSQLAEDQPAPVDAEVTRLTDEGIGLQFIL